MVEGHDCLCTNVRSLPSPSASELGASPGSPTQGGRDEGAQLQAHPCRQPCPALGLTYQPNRVGMGTACSVPCRRWRSTFPAHYHLPSWAIVLSVSSSPRRKAAQTILGDIHHHVLVPHLEGSSSHLLMIILRHHPVAMVPFLPRVPRAGEGRGDGAHCRQGWSTHC